MRALRSCDFCDGEATGTFEVLPPELEPTEAQQRRVVLCPDCKDRLESLLEPLLARIDPDDDADAKPTPGDDGAGVVTSADDSTQNRSRTSNSNATVSTGTDPSESTADDDAPDPERGPERERDSGAGTGISFDNDVAASTAGETVDGANETVKQEQAREPSPHQSETADATPPRAYGKVVRLLRNREFPMERSAVEDLAAGAYDLESEAVEAIIDHAIEDGEFVEKRGKLRRP
ncbi:hypothetical protein [Halopiger djelfimassiliensis]|uniref:hypothetical protein n=1 Tax=Halopiger djelfimassiliensis TaxID=1293047 RepID=UPI000677913B|nr:hypothetical protein [Halopiger djelfimassiliensis]